MTYTYPEKNIKCKEEMGYFLKH